MWISSCLFVSICICKNLNDYHKLNNNIELCKSFLANLNKTILDIALPTKLYNISGRVSTYIIFFCLFIIKMRD